MRKLKPRERYPEVFEEAEKVKCYFCGSEVNEPCSTAGDKESAYPHKRRVAEGRMKALGTTALLKR